MFFNIYLVFVLFVIFMMLFVKYPPNRRKNKNKNKNPYIRTRLTELQPEPDVYVMNGFYDYRINSIKLFVYSPESFSKMSCYLVYQSVMKVCKYYYKPYRTFTIPYGHLIIPNKNNSIPEYVILNNKRIKVNIPLEKQNKYNLTVCICRIINFRAANRFIQTVESYRRFGVDHFTLYLTSASNDVLKAVKYYESINLMEVIYGNKTFEYYNHFVRRLLEGQLAKVDDCIYRNMRQSKGVISVDIDEIIWPVKHNTLIEMINSFKGYNGFSFRSFQFHTEILNKNDRYFNRVPDADIFIYREYCIFKHGYVMKYIYTKLDVINSIFIHWPIDFTKGFKDIDVSYHTAYIRHTRRLQFLKEDFCETKWMNMEIDRREKEINIQSTKIRKMLNINPPNNTKPPILIKKYKPHKYNL